MKQKGFSLIECLLVVIIIGAMVYLLASIPGAMNLISKARHLSLAREIALKQIEDKRSITYSNISLGSFPITDSRLNMLPQGSGTIDVGVKNELTPDPDDLIPCDPSVCMSGANAKQIKVEVSWVDNNKPQNVTLETLISNGGINQ